MALVFVNRYFYPDISATSQMLSDLAMHAARGEPGVRVITGRQRLTDANARLPAHEYLHGIEVSRVWSTRFGRALLLGRAFDYLSFHLSAWVTLLRVLRPGDRVVAATDPPMLGVSVASAARLRGARLVNWLHDIFPETAMALRVPGVSDIAMRVLLVLRDRALRRASMNVVIGDLMARRVLACGISHQRITVIHNWSDGEAIRPVAALDNSLREAWQLQGKLVIGYSGNIGRAHDLAALPQVAARFADNCDVVFLIIGEGAGLPALREDVRARGLHNVVFKPYQPRAQLHLSLGAIDVHLISLRPQLEGLIVPSKIYGVLAAGRASVFMGDADGEVGQLLLRSGAGAVCAADDAQSLYTVLTSLHDDEAKRLRMGTRAREVFCAHYDKRHAFAMWQAVLDAC